MSKTFAPGRLDVAAFAQAKASLASYGLVAIFNNFSAQLFYIPLDPWLAVLAAGLATATGIVAAAIPARRAATLDPVQAIRHV